MKRYSCLLSLLCFFSVLGREKQLEREALWMPPKALMKKTQSGAHLSVPLYRDAVEGWYKLSKVPEYQKLVKDVLTREKDLSRDYYNFYSAFSNVWRVPQDLYLFLKKQQNPSLPIENFRLFRWLPMDATTPEKILKQEIEKYGLLNDNHGHIKSYFVCANYFIFGNVNFPGECTFEYFTNDKSNTKVNSAIFEGILKTFDVSEDKIPGFVERVSALAEKYLKTEPISNGKVLQTLAQIFIPKTLVDKVAYDAWVQGIPYDNRIVSWVENTAKRSFGRSPMYEATKEFLDKIRQTFMVQREGNKLYREVLEGIKEGRYHVGNFLDAFMKDPVMTPNGNEHQARLLVAGSPYLGNPMYECKIFTYDNVSQDKKDAYNKELKEIVADIAKSMPERAPDVQQAPDRMVSGVVARRLDRAPIKVQPKATQFLSQI